MPVASFVVTGTALRAAIRPLPTREGFPFPQSPLLPGSPLVDIEDLSLFLPGDARQKMILHHIDWHLCRGEHHLLLGHNGAGKTTAFNVVTGVYAPTNRAV